MRKMLPLFSVVLKPAPISRKCLSTTPFHRRDAIASHVMRAAAENLVPVTLELGGKSPVIVSETADMKKTAARVMTGKTLNAGQICLAPDYVMVPEGKVDNFVSEASSSVETMFPTLKDNEDYTSIVNQRHYDRLQSYLDDAREKVRQSWS